MIPRAGSVSVLLLSIACSAPEASLLTHPPQEHSFPMYVSVPGQSPGTGAIFKLDAPESIDGLTSATLLLGGLDFPASLAVGRDGSVYFAERPSPTTGRVSRLDADGKVTPILADLADPEGLAVDRGDRLYLLESGSGRMTQVAADGTLIEIATGLSGARSLAVDQFDNLLVSGTASGDVLRVIPNGATSALATGLSFPLTFSPGLVGGLYCLDAGVGDGDGVVYRVEEDGSKSTFWKNLINPRSMAWEAGTVAYVAEGAPVFRILKYSQVTKRTTIVARLSAEPHSVAFTPIN